MSNPLSDRVMAAEIAASVQRQKHGLRFVLLLAAIVSTSYVIRQAIVTPAGDPASVKCMKAGGTWQPEYHDSRGYEVDAFCGRGAPIMPEPNRTPPEPAK